MGRSSGAVVIPRWWCRAREEGQQRWRDWQWRLRQKHSYDRGKKKGSKAGVIGSGGCGTSTTARDSGKDPTIDGSAQVSGKGCKQWRKQEQVTAMEGSSSVSSEGAGDGSGKGRRCDWVVGATDRGLRAATVAEEGAAMAVIE
ncbi:hypothetical protein BHM03_00019159 [Ensete ventricosum]|nr:hypothetical protein BHM03_00019159 [Ensete ventricosum]